MSGNFKDPVCIFHKPLCFHGLHDPVLIVEGFLHDRILALKQSIVTLRVKQALFIESRLLKLVIHIGGDHKIFFVLHQIIQLLIHRPGCRDIAVEVNVSGPPGPAGFIIRKWIKTAGVHVRNAERLGKVAEILVEPGPGIRETGRGGQSGTGTDDHRICLFQGSGQFLDGALWMTELDRLSNQLQSLPDGGLIPLRFTIEAFHISSGPPP